MMKEVHTVLPAADLERARTYYHDKLGLEPDQINGSTMVFHPFPGGSFEIYETPNAGTAQNTQMGWISNNLDDDMALLRSRGVVFEEYDYPDLKTVNGVVEGDGMRTAWFRDSEGNYLCVSERT